MPHKDPEKRRQYHKDYGAEHYRKNKESYQKRLSTPEVKERRRLYRKRNTELLTRQRRISKFGRMPGFERVLAVLDSGDVSCESCGSKTPGSRKGWCVDHDHYWGVVRGILCSPCNLALGHVKDSVGRLQQLISYMERFLCTLT